jgi:hypothetical protein
VPRRLDQGLNHHMEGNKYKIAVVCICLNEPYWQFVSPMIESARKFFLKGHDVDFILWSDMPEDYKVDAKVIPTEPFAWPTPTLKRYHLFLREEELLKEYDFIYYIDADMKFVSSVGDEVLPSRGIMGAVHPMYYTRKEYTPPYEPNEKSTAFIPRPGRVIEVGGQKRFQPLYFAGGFQGGRTEEFIDAMKVMKGMIDADFIENDYIAIWNDESYWNKYLFLNPPTVVLDPSYVYPDSLNRQYYQKVWGRNYVPKLITITKSFSLTKDAGVNLQTTLKNL